MQLRLNSHAGTLLYFAPLSFASKKDPSLPHVAHWGSLVLTTLNLCASVMRLVTPSVATACHWLRCLLEVSLCDAPVLLHPRIGAALCHALHTVCALLDRPRVEGSAVIPALPCGGQEASGAVSVSPPSAAPSPTAGRPVALQAMQALCTSMGLMRLEQLATAVIESFSGSSYGADTVVACLLVLVRQDSPRSVQTMVWSQVVDNGLAKRTPAPAALSLRDIIASTRRITLDRGSHTSFLSTALASGKLERPSGAAEIAAWPVFYTIALHQISSYVFEAIDNSGPVGALGPKAALTWAQSNLLDSILTRCPPTVGHDVVRGTAKTAEDEAARVEAIRAAGLPPLRA